MKRLLMVVLAGICVLTIGASRADALHSSVCGYEIYTSYVAPGDATNVGYDGGPFADGTALTFQYKVTNTYQSTYPNAGSINYFQLSLADPLGMKNVLAGTIAPNAVYPPSGWTASYSGFPLYLEIYTLSTGSPIAPGTYDYFAVEYTVSSYADFTNPDNWYMGRVAHQHYVTVDDHNPSNPWSGETTPEPGTLMLLGSGLLGLAAFGRRRKRS